MDDVLNCARKLALMYLYIQYTSLQLSDHVTATGLIGYLKRLIIMVCSYNMIESVVQIHTYTSTLLLTHINTHSCTHTCTHTCTHARTHVYSVMYICCLLYTSPSPRDS